MSSSPKEPSTQTSQAPESSTELSDAVAFIYRSQTVKVVCTDSYKTTVDALIEACPKLLKAPRALIGLSLETSSPSGSQRQLTESNWPFFYKSKSRNQDAVINVTILPIPRPTQANAPYLDIPTYSSSHSDSEVTTRRVKSRAAESEESFASLPLSDRSNSCCPTCGSSEGSIKSETKTDAQSSRSNPEAPQSRPVSSASAPNVSTSTTQPIRRPMSAAEQKERHRQHLARERQLLDKATGYHAEKRRAQLAMQAQLQKTQDRYMVKVEKQKAKELKLKQKQQSGGRSSGVSSWINKIF